jgi:hypothetical protein
VNGSAAPAARRLRHKRTERPPSARYAWSRSGAPLLRIDVKKLARFRQDRHSVTGDRRKAAPIAGAGTTTWRVVGGRSRYYPAPEWSDPGIDTALPGSEVSS